MFALDGKRAVRDELLIVNGIAYIEGDLKLVHLRILLAIIGQLQQAILYRISRRKQAPGYLLPAQSRMLTIPVSSFGMGKHDATHLREYLDELRRTSIVFPVFKTSSGEYSGQVNRFKGFLASYDFPPYARELSVTLPEGLVNRLLLIEEGYTSVSFSKSASLTNKYTVRIYWLICAWRNRGGFIITVKELRRILCLSGAYSRFDNIVSRILAPSEKELEARFPIWFHYRLYDCAGEKTLAFKIMLHIDDEQRKKEMNNAWDYCFNLLASIGVKLHTIQNIFARLDYEDLRPFMNKIVSLTNHVRSHTSSISDPDRYILSVMESWFSNWLERYK